MLANSVVLGPWPPPTVAGAVAVAAVAVVAAAAAARDHALAVRFVVYVALGCPTRVLLLAVVSAAALCEHVLGVVFLALAPCWCDFADPGAVVAVLAAFSSGFVVVPFCLVPEVEEIVADVEPACSSDKKIVLTSSIQWKIFFCRHRLSWYHEQSSDCYPGAYLYFGGVQLHFLVRHNGSKQFLSHRHRHHSFHMSSPAASCDPLLLWSQTCFSWPT